VTIPVVQKHVDQTRAKIRTVVHLLVPVGIEKHLQAVGIDDFDRARESLSVLRNVGIGLNPTQFAGKVFAELTERRIVRHDDEAR
jgi:hypothetical protein